MELNSFKNSNEFDAILRECVAQVKLTREWIEKKWNLSKSKSNQLYEEAKKYNDEVFFHGVLYELSFVDEPPTVARIMQEFDVSYLLAQKLFEFYMENC